MGCMQLIALHSVECFSICDSKEEYMTLGNVETIFFLFMCVAWQKSLTSRKATLLLLACNLI